MGLVEGKVWCFSERFCSLMRDWGGRGSSVGRSGVINR